MSILQNPPSKFAIRALAAAAALAALGVSAVALAQDLESEPIIIGAIADPAAAKPAADTRESTAPALPVVYEAAAKAPQAPAAAAAAPKDASAAGARADLSHGVEAQ